MKPKVVILVNTLLAGGAERTVSNLLRYLSDAYELHLLLFEDKIEYELPPEQIIAFLDRSRSGNGDAINILRIPVISKRLVSYCDQHSIDLVLSFLPRPNFVACFAKKMGLRSKVLINERTYTPFWYKENELRGKIAKRLVSRLYALADAILTNSSGTLGALKTHYGLSNEIILVKNLLDLEDIGLKKHEDVDDVTFSGFTFIHVGSFNSMKGHDMLIDAFSELGADDTQLLFIGKGPLLESMKEKVASMGLAKKVLFLGHQPNPFKYLYRSDCFVFGSEFEGFPNVLLEAMACGIPVISTDCFTGPRELLAPNTDRVKIDSGFESGEFGMLVAVSDTRAMARAMNEILTTRQLRERYRNGGSVKITEYDQKVVVGEFIHIIDNHLAAA